MKGYRWMNRRAASTWPVPLATMLAAALLVSGCSARGSSSGRGQSSAFTFFARKEQVFLAPAVSAGLAGWCMERVSGRQEGGHCPYARSRPPILGQTWNAGSPPPRTIGLAVTTNEVAAVSIAGGRAIKTSSDPELALGLRTVVVESHGEDVPPPRFEPISATGRPITETVRGAFPLVVEVPTTDVPAQQRPTEGSCRIITGHLQGLTNDGGAVVSHIRAIPGLIGDAFLSCADTRYTLNGYQLYVSVLLDAARPGESPRSLPDMRPVSGDAGDFHARGSEGELVGHRVPGGWLVVSGGDGEEQRIALLKHVNTTVRL